MFTKQLGGFQNKEVSVIHQESHHHLITHTLLYEFYLLCCNIHSFSNSLKARDKFLKYEAELTECLPLTAVINNLRGLFKAKCRLKQSKSPAKCVLMYTGTVNQVAFTA